MLLKANDYAYSHCEYKKLLYISILYYFKLYIISTAVLVSSFI